MNSLLRTIVLIGLLTVPPARGADVPLLTMPSWTTSELNINSTGMIWRDCNRDGIIDAFFSNGNDIVKAANNIYLFGPGAPPTSAAWYSANLEYSGHCAVGDINDDGFPDLVVSNYLGNGFGDPNRSNLYVNNGGLPGTSPDWYTPEEIFSFSCAMGDVDGDGDLDIAFAAGEGYYNDYQQQLIYLNEGGVFGGSAYWRSAAYAAGMDVTWGDVDRDGDLDLALTFDNLPTAVFYNNSGIIETTPSWQAATNDPGNTLVFGDINGDDWLDLIVAYNDQMGGQGRFSVYFNDGAGQLSTTPGWQSATSGTGSALALYDYDNDGDDDLAAGRWFERLWVYENLGTTLTTTPVWTTAITMVAEELAWVDIDGQGVVDLVDTFNADGVTKLFYTERHPLYEIDSVSVDGARLSNAGYCYDLVSGWVSLAEAPTTEAICYYRYSFKNDLAVSNWDTVNMVFGNTSPPYVNVSAENSFGPVPLAVQFYDNSVGALAWLWDFGDGNTSSERNPQHTYQQPGSRDVAVAVTTPERTYHRTLPGMVSAYADTLWMNSAPLVSHRARVDIYSHNYLALEEINIPFSWAGPFNLRFDSMSVAGLETDNFDTHALISLVPSLKAATIRFSAGTQPPLAPGSGPIASLFFTDLGAASSGSSPIIITAYSTQSLWLAAAAGVYVPETVDGEIYVPCCFGRVGDANGVGGDEPTISDISAIIDMLFISGMQLPCLAEADINQSGGSVPKRDDITIGDVAILIDYLFITGSSLGLPDCL